MGLFALELQVFDQKMEILHTIWWKFCMQYDGNLPCNIVDFLQSKTATRKNGPWQKMMSGKSSGYWFFSQLLRVTKCLFVYGIEGQTNKEAVYSSFWLQENVPPNSRNNLTSKKKIQFPCRNGEICSLLRSWVFDFLVCRYSAGKFAFFYNLFLQLFFYMSLKFLMPLNTL